MHRAAGAPGVLRMVLSLRHVVFFIALLIVGISMQSFLQVSDCMCLGFLAIIHK